MKIIECPRDAMQGLHDFIPTEIKAGYINSLLKVGFDTIDFGSFVSPKAIPQMRDTAEVLSKLDLSDSISKLLAIIGNPRGAVDACKFEEISYLGYPLSVSEMFQMRNTNSTIEDSITQIKSIQDLCINNSKELVVYLSMAFGNPYGEPWSPEHVIDLARKLHHDLGVNTIALSDTIGVGNYDNISQLFASVIPEFPKAEIGAHLHTTPHTWKEKIKAAFNNGCLRFDGAIKGFGGCPMAKDELTGNMPTENIIGFIEENNISHGLSMSAFEQAMTEALHIFPSGN